MRYGSLCSGIGGLDLAVEAYWGATPAWHAEIEEAPSLVFERWWPGVPNLGDLTAVDWSQVEPVDVLTAGYPCQPFSHAGCRKGTDDHRHLWPYVADAVRALRPRWVVLENVAGHLSLGFDVVLGDLAEAGFDAEWCLLRASDVGAPHRRERVFIVAHPDRPGPQGPEPAAGRDVPTRSGGVAADAGGAGAGRDDRAVPGQAGEGAARGVDVHPAGDAGAGSHADPDCVAGPPPVAVDRRSDEVDEPGAVERAQRLRGVVVDWGRYRPAIDRWTATLGRPAPHPVDNRGRLNPPFVEWMMGYPEGWVDGLTRTQALKALGNAVVTRQALAALHELVPTMYVEEAA